MKTNPSLAGTTCPKRMAGHLRIACATRLLLLLLLTLPIVVQSQFYYTTNNGTITITKYTGPGGVVTIPDTIIGLPVTSIGDWAFDECTSLTSITIPNSVTSIGIVAFASCTSLTSITIPNSVPSIENYAFSGCTSLTNVSIGNSVTNIGARAFALCTSLTSVYFGGNAPNVVASAFYAADNVTVYYLPGTAGWGATFGGRPTIRVGSPEPSVNLYAGLTVTGAVGTVYSIEYVTDLAQTNNPSTWRCLEYLQLPASPYLWTDKSRPATGQRFYRAGVFPAPTNMVFIPPGTFRMGSPTNEVGRERFDMEGPQTAVTISRGYWMGKYEVTQGEYLALMGSNPSYFTGDTNWPVGDVYWNDATAYCAALTERERLAGRIGTNSVYRLPTEAEWEYGCRGWTSTRFSYGDDPGYTNLTNYAWYGGNSGGKPHPVGQKLPNPWGLHDMHGNEREWCQDWIGRYPGGMTVDPQGPVEGWYHVFRGGGYSNWDGGGDEQNRSAARYLLYPPSEGFKLGFRVVLAPGQP